MPKNSNTDLLPGLFAPSRLPWETILDSVRDGVICLEDGARVLFVNREAEKLFDIRREEVIGFAPEFSDELARLFAQASGSERSDQKDRPLFRREWIRRTKAGVELPLSTVITEAVHGPHLIQTAVVRDLSEFKRMEEALVQSRKAQAIGALAGGLAHDFNNILTALLSQLDLALDAAELSAPTREHIVQAQNGGRRAAELISRLQTFSRQTETPTTTVDLGELVEQVVLILRRSIDRRIQIRHDELPAREWLVKGDASQVIQVVFNLCLNARDAMPNGGQVNLRLSRANRAAPGAPAGSVTSRWIRLTVEDNGAGMAPEVMARLFEPYFTTKTLSRGAGLGLSIAQSILHDQGGWIEAESAVGAGSRFHVFLPETGKQEPPNSAALHDFVRTETHALDGKETILVVDDEEMVRLVIKAVLSYRGYRIVEAVDGENLIGLLEGRMDPVDLILLDVDMPRLNGWEALRRLKGMRLDAPVIMLSGGAVDSDANDARERGAAGFLAKPFKNDQLVQLVRRTLDARKPVASD